VQTTRVLGIRMTLDLLPHINAFLNVTSTILLVVGLSLIRIGERMWHKKVMISAIVVSGLFLVSYLTYHFTAPVFVFSGTGWTVPVYYTILISHVVLATVVSPLVVLTAYRAITGNFERHKKVARLTLPIWLYVTVTGVVIYVILYHVY